MEKVTSVSNLKASLSAYLNCVKSGEEILVTERGKPIARLVPYLADPNLEESRLQRLYREGIMRPGNGQSIRDCLQGRRPALCQASVVEALLSEREEGFEVLGFVRRAAAGGRGSGPRPYARSD